MSIVQQNYFYGKVYFLNTGNAVIFNYTIIHFAFRIIFFKNMIILLLSGSVINLHLEQESVHSASRQTCGKEVIILRKKRNCKHLSVVVKLQTFKRGCSCSLKKSRGKIKMTIMIKDVDN